MKKIEVPDLITLQSGDVWVTINTSSWARLVKDIEETNKAIESGVEVVMPEGYYTWATPDQCKHVNHYKKAYLIGIEPIEKDTVEKVLRDYVEICDKAQVDVELVGVYDRVILKRAKAVLSDKE